MQDLKIGIAGFGNGGHAFAAILARDGHQVTVLTTSPKKVEAVHFQDNRIYLEDAGVERGSGRIERVTLDPSSMADQDLILIITDAMAHKQYARTLAPYLGSQHVVLMSPEMGGSLEFIKRVKQTNPAFEGPISGTDTLLFVCRSPSPGRSFVKSRKKEVLYTTVGKAQTTDVLPELFPEFTYIANPLLSVDHVTPLHVVGMVENADRIRAGESFNFYTEGVTPRIAQTMEAMDMERCDLARELGIRPRSIRDWLHSCYDIPYASLYEMVRSNPAYQGDLKAPRRVDHRYMTEGIQLYAVLAEQMANILGIRFDVHSSMIDRASRILGYDQRKIGRKLDDIGFTPQDVRELKVRYAQG